MVESHKISPNLSKILVVLEQKVTTRHKEFKFFCTAVYKKLHRHKNSECFHAYGNN